MPGRRRLFARIVLPLWLLGGIAGATSLPEGAAVIALDADSGEILRLDNLPAATAAYPPGSLIKVFTALLACEDGAIDPAWRYYCRGEAMIDGRRQSCWLKGGHGPVNLAKALALSCNLYFLDLAGKLGPDRLREFFAQAGLGRNTGSDLPGEENGHLPPGWTQAEAALAGAGMSARVQVTPCQMAAGFAALINGGWIPNPHQTAGELGQRRPFSTPAALSRVRQALREGSTYGTTKGFLAATGGFAKTGTAAWEEGYHTSAWTAACFEAGGRKVSLVVYLPEGQGGRDALPLATEVARQMQSPPPAPAASPTIAVSLFSLLAPKELAVSAPAGWVEFDGGGDSRSSPSLSIRVAASGQLRVVTRDGPLPEPPPSLRLTGTTGELTLDVAGLPPRRISG
ncbi:MAG TPA: penicillin-binding transpeptidase domain-containing protein, partial [Candidatus Aminicenantes bacterium]|nr:penicillin-binding transpeptidase domain-containing protein [Candidatus Aminicenantes bacterium]